MQKKFYNQSRESFLQIKFEHTMDIIKKNKEGNTVTIAINSSGRLH